MTTLSRLGARAPIVLLGAGWIDAKKDRTTAIPVDSPIKAHYATFADKNGNFQLDPGEEQRAWEVAAARRQRRTPAFRDGRLRLFGDEGIRVRRQRAARARRRPLADGRRGVLGP